MKTKFNTNRSKFLRSWIVSRSTGSNSTPETAGGVTVETVEAQGVRWQDLQVAPEPAPAAESPFVMKKAPTRKKAAKAAPAPAPKDDRGFVTFLTQKCDPLTGVWGDAEVRIANAWVEAVGVNIPPLVITDALKTIPFHYPIKGATVTAHETGKVLVQIESDDSGLKTSLMYLAEKQAKYVKKLGGYPMNFKKFADFLHMVRNSERGNR